MSVSYQVIAYEQWSFVRTVVRQGQEHGAANDGWKRQEHKDRGLELDLHGDVSPEHRRDKLDETEGNIEQNRRETVEAERLDDQGAEGRDAAAGNRDGEHHREPKPGFRVKEGFASLLPFPDVIFDTLLVHSQST